MKLCSVQGSGMEASYSHAVTVLTHLARTQSSFNFYLQDRGPFCSFAFFFFFFFWWEADQGIHGQDEEGNLLEYWCGKLRSSEGLESPN